MSENEGYGLMERYSKGEITTIVARELTKDLLIEPLVGTKPDVGIAIYGYEPTPERPFPMIYDSATRVISFLNLFASGFSLADGNIKSAVVFGTIGLLYRPLLKTIARAAGVYMGERPYKPE